MTVVTAVTIVTVVSDCVPIVSYALFFLSLSRERVVGNNRDYRDYRNMVISPLVAGFLASAQKRTFLSVLCPGWTFKMISAAVAAENAGGSPLSPRQQARLLMRLDRVGKRLEAIGDHLGLHAARLALAGL